MFTCDWCISIHFVCFCVLRWCYMGRFATTIFSVTQRCNVGTMLFTIRDNVATVCWAKNRCCESSRVTTLLRFVACDCPVSGNNRKVSLRRFFWSFLFLSLIATIKQFLSPALNKNNTHHDNFLRYSWASLETFSVLFLHAKLASFGRHSRQWVKCPKCIEWN